MSTRHERTSISLTKDFKGSERNLRTAMEKRTKKMQEKGQGKFAEPPDCHHLGGALP